MRSRGGQAPRLYGLAKVHKEDIPVRPVLSMPGSPYHAVAEYVADCLAKVPQCNINASTKEICDDIKNVTLESDEEMISFDVVSLYTNVPLIEAIEVCADLLYALPIDKLPSVDKETFIQLAKLASCNVLMSTHDGYYFQQDGLAMGSPPAPCLANGWMSQYDENIKGDAKIFFRYMDDLLQNIKKIEVERKLQEINNLHRNLKFTCEREVDGELPVLDLKIIHDYETGALSSKWYRKPTDTGLIMNYHALAPKRYKRSIVSGFVHRIYRACSNWGLFHESLNVVKQILEKNQYPPAFYEPIIKEALSKILGVEEKQPRSEEETPSKKIMLMIQYRGKCTEDFARAMHKISAPCIMVMTLRKLKTVLPSLKPAVEKMLKSGVVYKITCPRCSACYVGQTSRHLTTRFDEHTQRKPVKAHLAACGTKMSHENIEILHQTARGERYLETLEALYIREQKPTINTKDEYRSRELTIKV